MAFFEAGFCSSEHYEHMTRYGCEQGYLFAANFNTLRKHNADLLIYKVLSDEHKTAYKSTTTAFIVQDKDIYYLYLNDSYFDINERCIGDEELSEIKETILYESLVTAFYSPSLGIKLGNWDVETMTKALGYSENQEACGFVTENIMRDAKIRSYLWEKVVPRLSIVFDPDHRAFSLGGFPESAFMDVPEIDNIVLQLVKNAVHNRILVRKYAWRRNWHAIPGMPGRNLPENWVMPYNYTLPRNVFKPWVM